MDKIDASWFACAVDAEGSLRLAIANRNPIMIGISNTNKGFLEHAQKVAGCGHIYQVTHERPNASNNYKHKPCFVFNICKHEDVLKILRLIEQYLIIKKEQARHIINFIEGRKWRYIWKYGSDSTTQVIERMKILASEGKSIRQMKQMINDEFKGITGIEHSTIYKYLKRLDIDVIRICRRCGVKFSVVSKFRYYCKNCGYLSLQKCSECGETFKSTHSSQTYCSKSCVAKSTWRAKKEIAEKHLKLYEECLSLKK